MQRGGTGHIEIIISFILFTGFVITAIYLFTPAPGKQIEETSLSYLLSSLLSNSSIEMQTYSIKMNNDLIPFGQEIVAVDFSSQILPIPTSYEVLAETYDGIKLPARKEGDVVYIKPEGYEFFILKFSSDFLPSTLSIPSTTLNPELYKITSSSARKIISSKRLLELNKSYYENYNLLKTDLNVPGGISFGFSANLPDKRISAEKEIPLGLEAFSVIARREILLSDSINLGYGEIRVIVW